MTFSKKEPSDNTAPLPASQLPHHVAIIMDGNGRWARERNLPRLAGHRAGTDNMNCIVELFADYNIPYLTLFAFSTENWSRPPDEVQGLMNLLDSIIGIEVSKLHANGIRMVHIGKREGVDEKLLKKIDESVELTRNNKRMTLNIAFNYGGRAEIVDAVRKIIAQGIAPEKVDEALIGSYLYTSGIPDPDLIIRTGGEMRISNFLVWQSVYSEYYATPVLWPDFSKTEVDEALRAYGRRKRRFGGL